MKKATFVESYVDRAWGKYIVYRVYNYRGQEYTTMEDYKKGNEPLSWQHRNAQATIDWMLDTKCKSTEPAEKGFELFWEYVEGEITEEDFGKEGEQKDEVQDNKA